MFTKGSNIDPKEENKCKYESVTETDAYTSVTAGPQQHNLQSNELFFSNILLRHLACGPHFPHQCGTVNSQ
jgi:hypothetical protein